MMTTYRALLGALSQFSESQLDQRLHITPRPIHPTHYQACKLAIARDFDASDEGLPYLVVWL